MKVKSESEVAQSCPTLSDTMDYSLPGSSVHGIFQARVLEWGAIAFSAFKLDYLLNTILPLDAVISGASAYTFWGDTIWFKAHSLFIHLPAEKQFGCFQMVAIIHKAAISIHVQFFFFFAVPWSLWDLSSLARDWTQSMAMKLPIPNHQTRELPCTAFYVDIHFHIIWINTREHDYWITQ